MGGQSQCLAIVDIMGQLPGRGPPLITRVRAGLQCVFRDTCTYVKRHTSAVARQSSSLLFLLCSPKLKHTSMSTPNVW